MIKPSQAGAYRAHRTHDGLRLGETLCEKQKLSGSESVQTVFFTNVKSFGKAKREWKRIKEYKAPAHLSQSKQNVWNGGGSRWFPINSLFLKVHSACFKKFRWTVLNSFWSFPCWLVDMFYPASPAELLQRLSEPKSTLTCQIPGLNSGSVEGRRTRKLNKFKL